MAFRNRPVLDRKHRPRWQDELRTQQLLVAGFALAIAVAVGIFAATAWSSFFETNLKQAALVGGEPVDRAAILTRVNIQAAELQAKGEDLSSQSVGVTGESASQQLQALQTALNQVAESGADSLVTGMVMDRKAPELGLSVSPDAVDAELAKRMTIPERRQLSLILVAPDKPKNAKPTDEPTDAAWAAAKKQVEDIKAQVTAGGDFAALAKEKSDDSASQSKDGAIGWVEADDDTWGEYFTAAKDAEVGDIVGPIRNDAGWYLVRVEDIRAKSDNTTLRDLLAGGGVSDEAYRDFVRQELLRGKFRDYFASNVVTLFEPQRKVSQIVVQLDAPGSPTTKVRIRHLLLSPIPGAKDQSKATAKQWQAALDRARALRREAVKPDADWWELAKRSDDTGSAARGGSLGWVDPGNLTTQFVLPFARAVQRLQPGETSPLVKSTFGYHIIQVTDRRTSVPSFVTELAKQLQDDPGSFADVARRVSDDYDTAADGGEFGWVLHYQLEQPQDEAIFGLAKSGDVSDPIPTTGEYTIYRLDDSADHRYAPKSARETAKNGFAKYLDQLKEEVGFWLDAEFQPTVTAAG
jgi:parvulin-like peptidyl-prolyl isomerase